MYCIGVAARQRRSPPSSHSRQQGADQAANLDSLRAQRPAGPVQDRAELKGGALELVIHNCVFELIVMRYVGRGVRESTRDGFRVVGAALAQPPLQRRARRRQNEDAGAINTGDAFPSGDTSEPGHPNCECYTQAASEIDLDSISIWDGS